MNICLGFLSVLSLLILTFFLFGTDVSQKSPSTTVQVVEKNKAPLSFGFQAKESEYIAIGEPFLHLEQTMPKGRLPDLRATLVGYGITSRPDAPKDKTPLLIGIRGQPNPVTIYRGNTLYLKYDPKSHYRWSFSEGNTPTACSIVADIQGGQTVIGFQMKDGQATIIKEPYEFSFFVLPEIPLPATNDALSDWRVGGEKVDNTLLMRQKAKWYGQDLFLQRYGGPEYEYARFKERIEFEGAGFNYACYVKEGDLLADLEGEWRVVEAGPESIGKSLLLVKKVSEQSITFDLWDQEGKRKITLELHRTPVPASPITNQMEIKLVGARSRKDWIAEIGGKRMLLRTDDWLLCHDGDCERLSETQQIDAYLSGDLKGELIILEGTQRVDTEICLVGGKVNESRTQITPISIPLFRSPVNEKQANEQDGDQENLPNQRGIKQNGVSSEKNGAISRADEDDEDDEDEDEDEDDDDYI